MPLKANVLKQIFALSIIFFLLVRLTVAKKDKIVSMPLKSDEKSVLDVLEVMALDMEIFVYFFSV